MKPQKNAQLFEGALATFWFDESGILCAQAKPVSRTLKMQKENYAFMRKICDNKKVCLLSDTTNSFQQDKKTRDYSAVTIPNIFKAMALISNSASGQFLAESFLVLKGQPIPIKYFTEEMAAKEWLQQYL